MKFWNLIFLHKNNRIFNIVLLIYKNQLGRINVDFS